MRKKQAKEVDNFFFLRYNKMYAEKITGVRKDLLKGMLDHERRFAENH